jgi:hypothetical protein
MALGYEIFELAESEQALGEGVGSAHGWAWAGAVKALGLTSQAVVAWTGWGYFSSLLESSLCCPESGQGKYETLNLKLPHELSQENTLR